MTVHSYVHYLAAHGMRGAGAGRRGHQGPRYLYTDDGSDWVGVFVRGPLVGRMTILDHDAPDPDPRFRDVSSFLDKLVDAARRHLDWPDMDTDYPLGPDSDSGLVADPGRWPTSTWTGTAPRPPSRCR